MLQEHMQINWLDKYFCFVEFDRLLELPLLLGRRLAQGCVPSKMSSHISFIADQNK